MTAKRTDGVMPLLYGERSSLTIAWSSAGAAHPRWKRCPSRSTKARPLACNAGPGGATPGNCAGLSSQM